MLFFACHFDANKFPANVSRISVVGFKYGGCSTSNSPTSTCDIFERLKRDDWTLFPNASLCSFSLNTNLHIIT